MKFITIAFLFQFLISCWPKSNIIIQPHCLKLPYLDLHTMSAYMNRYKNMQPLSTYHRLFCIVLLLLKLMEVAYGPQQIKKPIERGKYMFFWTVHVCVELVSLISR